MSTRAHNITSNVTFSEYLPKTLSSFFYQHHLILSGLKLGTTLVFTGKQQLCVKPQFLECTQG